MSCNNVYKFNDMIKSNYWTQVHLLCLVLLLGIFSCTQEEIQPTEKLDSPSIQSYSLADISASSGFAQAAITDGESRSFKINTKNLGELSFELKHQPSFKMGTNKVGFYGSVNGNKGAMMLVGYNGFRLQFTVNEKDYLIRGQEELDYGLFDIHAHAKNLYAELKANTSVGKSQQQKRLTTLESFIHKSEMSYSANKLNVLEAGTHYQLIQPNIVKDDFSEKHMQLKCGSDQLAAGNQSILNNNRTTSAPTHPVILEILYRDPTFPNYDLEIFKTVVSIWDVVGENFPFEARSLDIASLPGITLTAYANAVLKVGHSVTQIENMEAFYATYVSPRPNEQYVIKTSFYNGIWPTNGHLGASRTGAYGIGSGGSQVIGYQSSRPTASILAHETGHALGAHHSVGPLNHIDVMGVGNPAGVNNHYHHHDINNITTMRTALGL